MSDAIKKNEEGEIIVLGHDPVEPYPMVFKVVFIAGLVYLLVILILGASGGHAPAHH